jgi:hypothetical protein
MKNMFFIEFNLGNINFFDLMDFKYLLAINICLLLN